MSTTNAKMNYRLAKMRLNSARLHLQRGLQTEYDDVVESQVKEVIEKLDDIRNHLDEITSWLGMEPEERTKE